MAKIIGDIVGVPNPQSDCLQNDPTKADFVKNKHIFANAIRGKAHGESIVVDDVSPIEHALDVTVASKNLLPFPYYEKSLTRDGITFTVNSDGTVVANGTATKDTYFRFAISTTAFKLIEGQTYTFSGTPPEGQKNYYVSVKTADGKTAMYHDRGSGVTFTTIQTDYIANISITNGVTVNNVIFKPMLVLGDVVSEYTPYVDNVEGVTVKCADTLYSENAQSITSTAVGTVAGLHSISPQMALWAEQEGHGVIRYDDVIEKLYFDTNANIDDYLASLTYTDLENHPGICRLITNSSYSTLLCAVDLSVLSSGTVAGYALAKITMSSGTIMGIEVLYSSVEFILDFCRANKIGWQTDSADFAMTVYNLSPSFSPINGTVVKDEPNNVVVNVEYSRDTQKAIEKMIADAIASLA